MNPPLWQLVDAWRTLSSLALKTHDPADAGALIHARDVLEDAIRECGERGQQALERLGVA